MDERIAYVNHQRFWAKVGRAGADECWPWLGRLDRDGYGALGLWVEGRTRHIGTHRVAYELLVGAIPNGLVIDHLCRNRACQNPAHMEPVTVGENTQRGALSRFGPKPPRHQRRPTAPGGVCGNGHTLTESNTRPIKAHPHLFSCVDCERERMVRWKAKQPA